MEIVIKPIRATQYVEVGIVSEKEAQDDNVVLIPTLHRFNGSTKKFMQLVNDPKMADGYAKLLKELGCKPAEVSEKLRSRAWKGKTVHDIFREAAQD